MRREAQEDAIGQTPNSDRYLKLRDARAEACLKLGNSFIYDASIDRTWTGKKSLLEQYDYRWFIISLDLSAGLLDQIAKAVGSHESTEDKARWYQDHQDFLLKHRSEIKLVITDQNFAERTTVALDAVRTFLAG